VYVRLGFSPPCLCVQVLAHKYATNDTIGNQVGRVPSLSKALVSGLSKSSATSATAATAGRIAAPTVVLDLRWHCRRGAVRRFRNDDDIDAPIVLWSGSEREADGECPPAWARAGALPHTAAVGVAMCQLRRGATAAAIALRAIAIVLDAPSPPGCGGPPSKWESGGQTLGGFHVRPLLVFAETFLKKQAIGEMNGKIFLRLRCCPFGGVQACVLTTFNEAKPSIFLRPGARVRALSCNTAPRVPAPVHAGQLCSH
jgi:hypothetical protein